MQLNIVRKKNSMSRGCIVIGKKRVGNQGDLGAKKKCQIMQTAMKSLVVARNSSHIQILTHNLLDL